MRWTTALLLTLALLLPGAACAQPGFTSPYGPFGPQAGPLSGQNPPGAPLNPDTYDSLRLQPLPPYRPGADDLYRNPYSPNPPLIGSPLPRPEGPRLPPGFGDPADTNGGFGDPAGQDSARDITIPAVQNLPQIPPSVAFPPQYVENQMHQKEPEVQQEIGWIEYLPTIVLPILMGIGALSRRRDGKDDVAR